MPDPWRAALVLVASCVLLSLPGGPEPLAACASPSLSGSGAPPRVVCRSAGETLLRGPARRLFGLRIDLNRAAPATLESLPGIGPRRARAIARGRPYAEVEQLRRVVGIGPALLTRLRPLVRAESPAKAAAAENR